jgi:endonuclease/exonuclease/phosphatase family metal-dependent hydrolase
MIKILRCVLFVGFWSISLTGFSQQVVISEVYGGGGNTGATLKNDFIELYNPTSNSISLAGWSVQYASATGTSWQVTNLTGSIAAKSFYLIQQAQGAGGTVNLPTPDVIGTLALSASNGKVALCNTTTALSGSNPSGGNLVDLIGFGTATGFEGMVAPALTNTTSMERKANETSTASSMVSPGLDALLGNGFDSNNNLADFISRTPEPQNSSASAEPLATDVTPPVFISGFPSTSSIFQSQFDLQIQLDEPGTIYYVVLAHSALAPSPSQVKLGQDESGSAISLSGSLAVSAPSSTATKTITGLASGISYDIYVVAEDASSNLQTLTTKIEVTTSTSTTPIINISKTSITFDGFTAKAKQSAPQTYILSASDLTNDVSISISGNFLVSVNNSIYTSTISINKSLFSTPQTIYVKFNPSGNVGTQTGTITNSSTGASDKLISLSATAIDPFQQNFNDPAFLSNSGWTQFSKVGAQVWASTNFGRSCLTGCNAGTPDKGVQINGFASGSQNNQDWLISPLLDLTGFVNYPALSFWTISAFAGDGLQLKYSTDYTGTGDPTNATWVTLDGKFPASNSSLWTKSANIILPKLSMYVAIIYTSNTTAASRWTFDDWSLEDVASYIDVPAINYLFGEVKSGSSSASKSFSFTSIGYGDVTVSAPTGFELSTDNSTFSATVLVPGSELAIGKTIFVRFSPTSKQLKWEGDINFKGIGLDASFGKVSGSSYPKAETFDIATYNLEFFGTDVKGTDGSEFGPTDDALQINNVTTVLSSINADIYGVQEVADDAAFNELISKLPGYSGTLSTKWSYSFDPADPNFPPQKVGFIYNTSTVQLISTRVMFSQLYDEVRAGNNALLPNYPTTASSFWSSGRLPLMATFDVTLDGTKKRIRVLNIHSKSGSAVADYNRRKYDVKVLHDSLAANYPNDNIILLGDYNDDVDNSIASGLESSYKVFVDNTSNFNSLTYTLSQNGGVSFPNSSSFLDHIITSNELSTSYLANSINIEDVRSIISNYVNTTSDHLPVTARFDFSVKESQVITFNSLPTKTFGDAAFALSASSTSGLPITFTSSDPTIASITGSNVSILKAGTVTISAKQSGDVNFLAATDVVQSLSINKASQAITFAAITDKTFGDLPFSITASSTSGLVVSLTPNSKVTVNGSQASIAAAGKASITASQLGNENYLAAEAVTREFCIKPAKPIVTVSFGSGTATLSSDAVTGNQWFLNGTIIEGAINSNYTTSVAGSFKTQVTIETCVSEFSNETPIVITGDLTTTASISVYPNPTTGKHIYITGVETEVNECIVVDLLGREIKLPLEKANMEHQLNIESFSEGIYLLKIPQANTVKQIRFIKKN